MLRRTLQLSGEKDINNDTIRAAAEICAKYTGNIFGNED